MCGFGSLALPALIDRQQPRQGGCALLTSVSCCHDHSCVVEISVVAAGMRHINDISETGIYA
jgi:hypothetical protein